MERGRGRPKIEPPSEEYNNFLRKTLELVHNEEPCPVSKILNQICGGDEYRLEGWFGKNGNFVREDLIKRLETGRESHVELTPRGELMYRVIELAPTAEAAAAIVKPKSSNEQDEAIAMISRAVRLQRLGLRRLRLARKKPVKEDEKKSV